MEFRFLEPTAVGSQPPPCGLRRHLHPDSTDRYIQTQGTQINLQKLNKTKIQLLSYSVTLAILQMYSVLATGSRRLVHILKSDP